MAIERALGAKHRETVWPSAVAWSLTMVCVMLGWVVFRAETLAGVGAMYAGMVGVHGFAMRPELVTLTTTTELCFLLVGVAISIGPRLALPRRTLSPALHSALLSILCFVALQARTNCPFLYFQF